MKKLISAVACIATLFFYHPAFSAETRGAWIDIPTSPFIFSEEENIGPIKSLVDNYHRIDKKNLKLVTNRISILNKIHESIVNTQQDIPPSLTSKLQKLDVIAQKKAWYLEQIQELYNNPEPYKNFLNANLNDSLVPLIFVNKVIFDFKLPTYWGLYWLEGLDPCHRFLTAHYLKWKKETSTTPFFLWLEEQEIPYNAIQIVFINEAEIPKHQLEIKNGIFVSAIDKKAVSYENPNQEYIFVINLEKKLIVIEGSESIRHSSLSYGKPVLGAGSLKIHNGKLTYIDAESGHYQPTPTALLQALKLLEKQGAILDYSTIKVKYYDKEQVIQSDAGSLMQQYKELTIQKPTTQSNTIKNFKI